MADTNDGAPGQEPTDANAPTTGEGAGDTKPEGEGEGTEGTTPPEPKTDDVDSLPEWARKSLTAANQEAAKYRTQLREVQDKLKDAKTPEEVDAITRELSEKATKAELDAARERAGRKFGLPDAVVGRLTGDDEAAILADAESLAPLFGKQQASPPPPTPSGGREPKRGTADEESPVDAYKKARSQQRFR